MGPIGAKRDMRDLGSACAAVRHQFGPGGGIRDPARRTGVARPREAVAEGSAVEAQCRGQPDSAPQAVAGPQAVACRPLPQQAEEARRRVRKMPATTQQRAQEPCVAKSNASTAFLRLLDRINLARTVVTIDAAGCQATIVQDLRAKGTDYLLAVKRSQPHLHAEVAVAFTGTERGAFTPEVEDRCETVERNSGRTERCTGTVLGDPGLCEWVADLKLWPDLRSLIRMQTHRMGRDGRRQHSVRYYISSLPMSTGELLAIVPGHWGVENGLCRTLDVQFREDDYRLRRGHAPAVMGILRRAALNMVRTVQQNVRPDLSIRLLRHRIACNLDLMTPLVT